MSIILETHDEELVKKVQEECRGFPLALQVIISTSNGESDIISRATTNVLGRGKYLDGNKIRVLNYFENRPRCGERQCFLDLNILPKRITQPHKGVVGPLGHFFSNDIEEYHSSST